MLLEILDFFVNKGKAVLDEAHRILALHESAPSRVVLLDDTYKRLQKLSFAQDELLRQALRCTENNLYRAAHVLAWIALVDLIENILASDGFRKLNMVRNKWELSSIDDLREKVPEYQIVEVCNTVKLTNRGEMKLLHGLLNKRNLCAHPSDFFPDLNQTIGFIADILDMMQKIQGRRY